MSNAQPIAVVLIDPPANAHRIDFDETEMVELMQSIEAVGLINPITVRHHGERYQVVAGHRRLVAHTRLGRLTIPAIVLAPDGDNHAGEIQFAENFQRSNLSPIEEAIALQRQYNANGQDLGALAQTVKRSVQWVEQRLSLLDLPDDLGPLVHTRKLPIATALMLAKVTDDAHRQYLTTYAVDNGATTAVIRSWVDQWHLEQTTNPGQEPTRPTLPAQGETPHIQWPCWSCHQPFNAVHMIVKHVCHACASEIERQAQS